MANGSGRYLSSLRALLFAPAIRQVIFLLGISASTALGFYLFNMVREPEFIPLDIEVNQKNISAITDAFNKGGIKYRVSPVDGTLYVDENDVQKAKIKLSAAGIQNDDSFNFSYLNDTSGFGNSQFQEGARYTRALESDLARTISGIDGVSNAIVHIAIPKNNIFVDENQKPTASIVIMLRPGLSGDMERIRAIVQIVASSVPGLDPKDVAITDQYGHYLSSAMDKDAITNAQQFNYQNNIQTYYEKRIESMIAPIIGQNKVNVRVHADIDFTQQEEAQEQYDPDKSVVVSEQKLTEESGNTNASGAPGALSNTPPDASNSKSSGSQSTTNEGKTQSIKNYEVSKSVIYKKSTQPKIMSLSAAVIIDNEQVLDSRTKKMISKPLEADKIAKITEIIKATIGYDEKRGDKISVLNSSFQTPAAALPVEKVKFWEETWFWSNVKKIIGIILGFAILYSLYMKLSKYAKNLPPVELQKKQDEFENVDELSTQLKNLKQNRLERLKDMASKDPDRVALILKDWVGK